MDLPKVLIDQFAKVTNDEKNESQNATLYGTIKVNDGINYVQLDGSDLLTPCTTSVNIKDGERVMVVVGQHEAVVTGNMTSPAARVEDVKLVDDKVGDLAGDFLKLDDSYEKFEKLATDKFIAHQAAIDELVANKATIGDLQAVNAEIKNLTANKANVSDLKVTNEQVDNLKANKANVKDLNVTNENVKNLTANKANVSDLKVTNEQVDNLNANKANITDLNAAVGRISNLEANRATIDDLKATNATVEKLNANKANIDLANVDNAWITKGILKDGSIGTGTIHDGAITNAKIADATIEAAKIRSLNADSITAGTLKTERLIITGPDGQDSIVKAINIANGISEAEVNNTKIQAASIDVADLSAFHAKLAQFDVNENYISSGKTSIEDPTAGILISTNGIGMGDGALTGKNVSPMQAKADGSLKLTGKNSDFDFNAVTGSLDMNVSSLKVSSKAVITSINKQQTSGDTPGLKVTFSAQTQTEGINWDYVLLLYEDSSGNLKCVGKIGGQTIDKREYLIPATEFYLFWRTDTSNDGFYGFSIDSIESVMVDKSSISTTSDTLPTDVDKSTAIEVSGTNYPESDNHGSYGNSIKKLWKYVGEKKPIVDTIYKVEKSDGTTEDLIIPIVGTEFIQNVYGWEMKWDKIFKTDNAKTDTYTKYITFDDGNIVVGRSDSNNKLELTNDSCSIGDINNRNVNVNTKGVEFCNGNTVLAHVGYDQSARPDADSYALYPYYVFGLNEQNHYPGGYSFEEGVNTQAIAYASHSEGDSTTASGYASHAEGYGTNASGNTWFEGWEYGIGNFKYVCGNHAEGYKTTSSGAASHSEGISTIASSHGSHAEGSNTTASSTNDHAEGNSTTASGGNSHAEGNSTTASGQNSHAEGSSTRASSQNSHAEGCNTTASGWFAHAEGYNTEASGKYSHAAGYNTEAAYDYQTVVGKNNVKSSNAIFIVGNGSETAKSNAFSVFSNGDATSAGTITAKGFHLLNTATSSGTDLVFSEPTNPLIPSTGGYIYKKSGSSKRFKIHEAFMNESDVEKLYDLRPVYFKYKPGYLVTGDQDENKLIPGFYAELVEKYFPEAVRYDSKGRVADWDPKKLVPAMLKLIQLQKEQLDKQEERLSKIESLLNLKED